MIKNKKITTSGPAGFTAGKRRNLKIMALDYIKITQALSWPVVFQYKLNIHRVLFLCSNLRHRFSELKSRKQLRANTFMCVV